MSLRDSARPTRTCVGCRERRSAHLMVRCVERPSVHVARGSQGRGAWVCSVDCFDRALATSGFAKAWRHAVDREGLSALRNGVVTNLSTNTNTIVKDCD